MQEIAAYADTQNGTISCYPKNISTLAICLVRLEFCHQVYQKKKKICRVAITFSQLKKSQKYNSIALQNGQGWQDQKMSTTLLDQWHIPASRNK